MDTRVVPLVEKVIVLHEVETGLVTGAEDVLEVVSLGGGGEGV